jgi:competence protein ComEA
MNNPLLTLSVRERFGLAAAAGTILALAIGGWQCQAIQASPLTSGSAVVVAPAPSPSVPLSRPLSASPAPPPSLVVYVSGAVRRPGLYTLRSGQRIYHAIQKAGGFKTSAQEDTINLADRVCDSDQIVVPTRAAVAALTAASVPEPPAPSASSSESKPDKGRVVGKPAAKPKKEKEPAKPGKFKKPGDGIVHLNKATLDDLQRLPGVGPAMAERILEYRKEAGKFTEIAELRQVKGIGEKKYAKLEPFVRAD